MPKNQMTDIIYLTDLIYKEIEKVDLTKGAKQGYWYSGIIPIRKYFTNNTYKKYTVKRMEECIKYYRIQYEEQGIQVTKYRCTRKISILISEYLESGSISWSNLPNSSISTLSKPMSKYMNAYINYKLQKGYKETTIRGVKAVIKHFLQYISSLGYDDLIHLEKVDITNYIPTLSKNYSKRSLSGAIPILRDFTDYLFEQNKILINCKDTLQIKVPFRKKYYKGFSKDEIKKILSQIDCTTICGKRDYAILMIAAYTGLRGIDVLTLTFSNIDWSKQEIYIKQSKTEKDIALPVSTPILNAIADYILNARPDSENEIIFLRIKHPLTPLKSWSAHSIVKRYAMQAGIFWTADEHKGFHSFRRSIAGFMLDAKVPIDTIKEVLGHSNVDSTRPYIATHTLGLSACALNLEFIPTRRGELL